MRTVAPAPAAAPAPAPTSKRVAAPARRPAAPPPYRVVLLNDDMHTFGEVIQVLQRVFDDMGPAEARARTRATHMRGRAVLRVLPQPDAEARCERLRANAMRAIVESD